MARGFAYLVAIIDWYARRVLAWRLSNTLDTGLCLEALRDALTRFGRPTIFNIDPGSQFTSGDLDPVSAHRRRTARGSRHRPAGLVAGHDDDENRPSRLHLDNARFWSKRWGPRHESVDVRRALLWYHRPTCPRRLTRCC